LYLLFIVCQEVTRGCIKNVLVQALLLSSRNSFLSPRGVSREDSLRMKRYLERSKGSFGTYVPRKDKKESVPREDMDGLSPRASFFVAPSRKRRGVSNCQKGDFSLRSKWQNE